MADDVGSGEVASMCPMMFGMNGGLLWGWMVFMALGGLLLLAALGIAIYVVARHLRRDDALMVLRRRFAQGEITEEEYRERRTTLYRQV